MDSARGAEAAIDRDRKEPLGDPTGMSRPGAGEFLPEAAMADAVLGASCVDPPIPCTAANVSAVGGGVEFRRLLGAKSRRGRSGECDVFVTRLAARAAFDADRGRRGSIGGSEGRGEARSSACEFRVGSAAVQEAALDSVRRCTRTRTGEMVGLWACDLPKSAGRRSAR